MVMLSVREVTIAAALCMESLPRGKPRLSPSGERTTWCHFISNVRNDNEKSNLYIKLGLPLMSQLQQQQSQVVQTHKAKMEVTIIVNIAMITRMVTCLGRRKHIGRGRCIEVFAAVPSAWGGDKF